MVWLGSTALLGCDAEGPAHDGDSVSAPRADDPTVEGPPLPPQAPPMTPPMALPACGTVDPAQALDWRTATPIPPLIEPPAGQRFADPTFGSCLTRLTDHATQPPRRFARNAYSRRQSFNADDTRVLIMGGNGGWHLYDPATVRPVATLAGLAGDIEPHWHPDLPDRLFHLGEDGAGMRLFERDLITDRSRTLADLGARLQDRWPRAAIASTRSEGAPSRDTRHWAWLVESADQQPLGLVVWDRERDAIVATRDIDAQIGNDIDWVSMSPSGQFVVVAGQTRTLAFDRELRLHGTLHESVEHADLALDARGRDVYVSVDFASSRGWLFMVDIATLTRTNLVSTYNRRRRPIAYTSLHVSGKAYERPGWALVSTYRTRSERIEWFQDKVMLVELVASPRIVRLADHRSAHAGYWTEPHAGSNRDLSRVLFNSNWGSGSTDDVDTWHIDVPTSAFEPR